MYYEVRNRTKLHTQSFLFVVFMVNCYGWACLVKYCVLAEIDLRLSIAKHGTSASSLQLVGYQNNQLTDMC
jgi:hypothetical protein